MTPKRLIEPARLAGTAVLRTQSDDRLVDLVREGNDRAFEAVVHRYRGPLLRYCRRYLSPARAEDAVQQTFVNAIAAIRDGEAEINLRPWLYRIAHNASLNVLRQAGADHEQISEQIDGVETPPQALERGERFRSVVAAVHELPERQRDALVLQALEGRSYDEIAAELGVTGGAVRQLLNRARTTLRDGVTAFTPPALLARLGGVIDAPVAERVAQVVAGAGGGAALAKAGAVIAVAGAVVGGATDGILSQRARDAAAGHSQAQLAAAPAARDASSIPAGVAPPAHARPVALKSRRHRHSGSVTSHGHGGKGSGRSHEGPSRGTSTEHHHGGSRDEDSHHGDHSGSGGEDDDAPSTTLSDDRSGSGDGSSDDSVARPEGTSGDSSGSDSGSSGPGSGSDGSLSGGGSGDDSVSGSSGSSG